MDMSEIAKRLEDRFGLGSRPDLRRRLYEQLEDLVYAAPADEGQRAYEVIAGVASDAVGKSEPGRYFAHVVKLRLVEKGLLKRVLVDL